jgi:hypothetical protein
MSIKNIKNDIKSNFGLNLSTAKALHHKLGVNYRVSPNKISLVRSQKLNNIYNKLLINKSLVENMEKCLLFKKKINIQKNSIIKMTGDKKKINPSKKKKNN